LPTAEEIVALQIKINQERKKIFAHTGKKVDSQVLHNAQQYDFLRRADGQFPTAMRDLKRQMVDSNVNINVKLKATQEIWYTGFNPVFDHFTALEYANAKGIGYAGDGDVNKGCIVQVVNQKRNEMRGDYHDFLSKHLDSTIRVSEANESCLRLSGGRC
jgi:hypothetical protein